MKLKIFVVFLAIIVEVAWSQRISDLKLSRYKRDDRSSIIYGNINIQAHNNFTIDPSLPAGSQVIGGSILNQAKNQYLTIAESGKLAVVMPDMIQLPDPLVVLGLSESQEDTLLNITHEEHNARIIYNLKQSLHAFNLYSERMSQAVDSYILQSEVDSDENPRVRMWHASLTLHRLKTARLDRTLNRSIEKIKVGDVVQDADVQRAKSDASNVLRSHKNLAIRMMQVLNGY